MPKKTPLSDPEYVAHLPQNGHNLSHRFTYTSSTGMILPVLYDMLSPGEKVDLAVELFTRTQPMVRPAIIDVEQFVDFFFVPMTKFNMLWKQMVTNTNDIGTTAFDEIDWSDNPNLQLMPIIDFSSNLDVLSDFFTDDISDNPTFDPYNTGFFESSGRGLVRLFDMLDLNPSQFGHWLHKRSPESNFRPRMGSDPATFNPVYLAAYQAIYMDYYRLTDYEENDPFSYNFDWCISENNMAVSTNIATFNNRFGLWQLRYAPYRRDYFRNVKRSPLFASGETIVSSLFNNIQKQAYNRNVGVQTYIHTAQENEAASVGINTVAPNPAIVSFNLQNLRAMLATNKMMSIQGRARAHYDEQIMAHFGVKTPKGIADEVYYLGGHHQSIMLQDVVATASNVEAEEPLGALAGRGLSRNRSKDIKFTAPCHGILMAVQYSVPRPNYTIGLSKLHTWFTQYDLPQPELDKLGMQPLYDYEFMWNPVENNRRSGWQWRYQEYKLKPNRVTHAFANRRYVSDPVGGFRAWSNGAEFLKQNYSRQSLMTVSDMLCPPTALNDIMVGQYSVSGNAAELFVEDGTSVASNWPQRLYDYDPFINEISFKYFKTSFMSTFGIEDINNI